MKVILKEDVEKLGKFGDVVDVSNGYARNYLIPKDKVWPYDDKYMNLIEKMKYKNESMRLKEKEAALKKSEELEGTSVTVQVEVGEEDKLFGSVTNIDIAEKLIELGLDIDKKDIQIAEPIKKLGVFKVGIKLHPEVEAFCKVWVVKKS
ncbi:MAG: 50S ribosomal protein L9 [Elusimicrobiota bacterium]